MWPYQTAVTLALAGLLLHTWRNLRDLPKLQPTDPQLQVEPTVSVLIPARNEGQTVGALLSSLSAQPEVGEILVLDDGSTDNTAAAIDQAAARDRRIRRLVGETLPDGWIGKSWACDQLGRAADPALDWRLFLDADTTLQPGGVGGALSHATSVPADLLTLIPQQIMGSLGERLVLPMLYFGWVVYLPIRHIASGNPAFAVGNGQFMLIRRAVYERIGGHRAVAGAIVEDVWLSRAVMRSGGRVVFADGQAVARCRMYTSLPDAWRGFSKNLFAGLNRSVAATLGLCLMKAALFVAPVGWLIVGMVSGRSPAAVWIGLPLVQLGLGAAIRLLIARRFGHRLLPDALFIPVSAALFIGIALNSMRWSLTGGGPRWKGRRYSGA